MMTVIARGAEAVITLEDGKIVKTRVAKGYRLGEIDHKLRSQRTRTEGKLLLKAGRLVPKVHLVDERNFRIVMERAAGELVRDIMAAMSDPELDALWQMIGAHVGALHDRDIIHGDLTTSNFFTDHGNVSFIDFGLGFVSAKDEDKAVDIRLLRQSLEGKHHEAWERCWGAFLQGYDEGGRRASVLKRLEKVERRGRYKRKFDEKTDAAANA